MKHTNYLQLLAAVLLCYLAKPAVTLAQNLNVNGDLSVTGNTSLGGKLTLGSGSTAASGGIALGESSNAGEDAFAWGENANAQGHYSLALGPGSHASGSAAVAIGWSALATGDESVAIGGYGDNAVMATAWLSTAFGFGVANGSYSLAAGGAVANGSYSVALGNQNSMALGDTSFAFGYNSFANGGLSIAMGGYADANGEGSMAIGGDYWGRTEADGDSSVAIGLSLNSNTLSQTTIGVCNDVHAGSATTWVSTDDLFVIGNGEFGWKQDPQTSEWNLVNNPSNALTVKKDGTVLIHPQGDLLMGGFTAGPQP